MTIIAILLLMAIVSLVIWKTIFTNNSSFRSSVKSHARTMDKLKGVVHNPNIESERQFQYQDDEGDGPDTTATRAITDDDYLESEEEFSEPTGIDNIKNQLPPMITVATAIGVVIVIVAIISAILIMFQPSGTSKKIATSNIPTTNITASIPPVSSSTSLASLKPVSSNASGYIYNAPQGTYKISVTTSVLCWVEITQIQGTKTIVKLGGVEQPGTTNSVTVSGSITLTLGKGGSTVKINGVPVSFPNNHDSGVFIFQ